MLINALLLRVPLRFLVLVLVPAFGNQSAEYGLQPARPDRSEPLVVTATLPSKPLGVGSEHRFEVSFHVAPRWTERGIPLLGPVAPKPLLQLAAPDGLEWTGPRAETPDAILRAAYVDLPFERVLAQANTRIGFRLTSEPNPESAIEFNVLVYLLPPGQGKARVIRQRYRLPLRPGARAERVSAATSTWGSGQRVQLGQRFPALTLPRVFGPDCTLADVVDDERPRLVVMTYHSCL